MGFALADDLKKQLFQRGGGIAHREQLTLVALAVTVIVVIGVKAWTGRGTPLRGGLPSGHAAVAFAGWMAVTLILDADEQLSPALAAEVAALRVKGPGNFAAFDARAKLGAEKPGARFFLNPALAISIGLEEASFRRLLGGAGFRCQKAPELAEGAFGPPAPDIWLWRPRRKHDRGQGKPQHSRTKGKRPGGKRNGRKEANEPAKSSGAFDALAELIR